MSHADKPEQVLRRAQDTLDRADKLLAVWQAARRLNRSPEFVRRAIRAGRLRAHRPTSDKIGGHYLIPESAIADFLNTPKHN